MRFILLLISCFGVANCATPEEVRVKLSNDEHKLWEVIRNKHQYEPEFVNKAIENSSEFFSVVFESDINVQIGKVALIKTEGEICALKFSNPQKNNKEKSVFVEIAPVEKDVIRKSDIKKFRLHVGKLWGFFHFGYQSGNTKINCNSAINAGWSYPSFVSPWGNNNIEFTITSYDNLDEVILTKDIVWYTSVKLLERKPIRVK